MTNTRFKHVGNWNASKNGSTAAQNFGYITAVFAWPCHAVFFV